MVGRSARLRGVPPGRGHPAPHEGVVGLLAPAFSIRPGGLSDPLICHRLESTLEVVTPRSFHSEPLPL